MSDTLVFDIETQNFFTDPNVGWDNFAALKISVVGVYSYDQQKYFCFTEDELPQMLELFRDAARLVGFSINRYDIPVLNLYAQRITGGELNLWHKERVDLLEEIEVATGARVSLSKVAQANLGVAKDRHGSEAITLYANGQIEELKKYCLKDVELTKGIYELYKDRGYLFVPNKATGEIDKTEFAIRASTAPLL